MGWARRPSPCESRNILFSYSNLCPLSEKGLFIFVHSSETPNYADILEIIFPHKNNIQSKCFFFLWCTALIMTSKPEPDHFFSNLNGNNVLYYINNTLYLQYTISFISSINNKINMQILSSYYKFFFSFARRARAWFFITPSPRPLVFREPHLSLIAHKFSLKTHYDYRHFFDNF